MKNENEDSYLLIESKDSDRTAEFYRCLGYKVTKGYPLGDYLVYTNNGQITINQMDNKGGDSKQIYKPFYHFNYRFDQFDEIIKTIKLLGCEVISVGEFYDLSVYESSDFSGGFVTLVCHKVNPASQP